MASEPQTLAQPVADKAGEAGSEDSRISIAGHPRAKRMVSRARGYAGLAGFLIAGYMSLPTHTLAGTLLSAVIAGVACQVVVWGAAVLLSRPLILAELRERELALVRAARERAAAPERPADAASRPRSASASGRGRS